MSSCKTAAGMAVCTYQVMRDTFACIYTCTDAESPYMLYFLEPRYVYVDPRMYIALYLYSCTDIYIYIMKDQ